MERPLSQPSARSGLPGDRFAPTPAFLTTETVVGPRLPEAPPREIAKPGRPPIDRRRHRRRRRRYNRHLRDALTRRQRISLGCFIAAWTILEVGAWRWWFTPGHAGSAVGMAFNTALLAIESVILPGYFLAWIWRMRRPDRTLAVPPLRAAMVVTKAPSEPWSVVRETLEAMLDQDLSLPYAVWLADEQPTTETALWCAEHGVRISTRFGVAEYHRPTWPRRTRCKEGNLAYFYDHWGYELYDVVAQLDADHVPERDYLRNMLVPFHDPDVGYVAAPSMCDRNARRSWSARARLYAEAVLHGPMQAGHSGGCAPSCIGSHYAVRTAALREVGGIGPELAEDFTTSLILSSRGWQGVFAIDARAHGDGPATAADFIMQEFQWSRSMMNVLLGINGRYWRGLRRAAKLRLGFCQVWYPLFGLLMLASVVLPLVAIFARTPLMRVSLGSFYLHFAPPVVVLVLIVLWLRRLRWLRPTNARVLSWEMLLYQLVRWPWVLIGCGHAIAGRMAGREFTFRVTPKGEQGARLLPTRVLAPYLGLAAVSALPAALRFNAGPASGYFALALLNVGLYLGTAIAIVALHILDHPPMIRQTVLRNSVSKIAVLAAATAMTLLALGVWSGVAQAATPPRPIAAHRHAATLAVGVTTPALADNSYLPWKSGQLSEVSTFERSVHVHARFVLWYADWQHSHVELSQLRAVSRRGSIPEITWEPWDYSGSVRQPRYSLSSIIAGRHDAYIRSWALALRAYGKPVLLRFAQEMNGTWYPWSEGVNGNRRGEFLAAWRHVHDLFRRLHTTNVRWVWSPVARGHYPLNLEEYPGSAYVDIIGLSGFNAGTALPSGWGGWRSFAAIFGPSLDTLYRTFPAKPEQISEVSTASRGGAEAAWLGNMFRYLAAHPQVSSLIWFDLAKQTDWRITNAPGAPAAFAAGLRWLARHAR